MARSDGRSRTTVMVTLAMLTAAALVLFFIEIPIFAAVPMVSFLKLDFSDIPALAAGITLGPVYSLIVELLKNVIEMLIKGIGEQMGFGNLLNFIVGVAFVLPFSALYGSMRKKQPDRPQARPLIISSVTSVASIAVAGILFNSLITPLFFRFFLGTELPGEMLKTVILFATLLNVIKGVILSVSGAALAKPLQKVKAQMKL